MGFKPIRSTFQIDNMDETLRNRLWNCLKQYYWDGIEKKLYERPCSGELGYPLSKDKEIKLFYEFLWDRYFKKSLDTLNLDWSENHNIVREHFFSCPWYEVYDFIEFVVNFYCERWKNDKFKDYCNSIL